MAPVTKGQENLQQAIATCEQLQTALATASAPEASEVQERLRAILTDLTAVQDKFFLKTTLSVPPTKACKTEAAAIAALVEAARWPEVPAALAKLEKASKALLTKAKMDGTTIT